MSKIHVLEGGSGGYHAVVHFAVPAGNNTVGIPWKTCVKSVGGSKVTSMVIGTAAGQITQAEADQITAGDVIEFSTVIASKPDGSAPSTSEITSQIDAEISKVTTGYAAQLKYFGYTQD